MKPNTPGRRCPTCGATNPATQATYWLVKVQRKWWRDLIVITASGYAAAMKHPQRVGRIKPWHPPMSLYDTARSLPRTDAQRKRAAELARQRRHDRAQAERDQIARWIEEGASSPITLEPVRSFEDPNFYGAIIVNGRKYFLNRAHWWPVAKDSEA